MGLFILRDRSDWSAGQIIRIDFHRFLLGVRSAKIDASDLPGRPIALTAKYEQKRKINIYVVRGALRCGGGASINDA